jgi:hypothetical protein
MRERNRYRFSLSTRPSRQLKTMRPGRMKIEGGSGGKRGHSNMAHWVTTEEIKVATRKARRAEAKELERCARMGNRM